MKRFRPTPFGLVLSIATVVLLVAVAVTRWTPVVIALVLVLVTWGTVLVSSTPSGQIAEGNDPAADAEQPWRETIR